MKRRGVDRGWSGKRQSGQTLIMFALAMVVIFGLVGLAVEGGLAQGIRRSEQAISDGAALAGAIELNSNPTSAQQRSAMTKAVAYVAAGLAGGGSGTPAPSCAAPSPPTLVCQPDSKHSLSVTTPFNGNSTDIMVRLTDLETTTLSSVVGINQVSIGARSVARHLSGGGPFGYALYVSGDLTAKGNVQTLVKGNVYVGGCVIYDNSSTLTTGADGSGSPGNVEIFGKNGAEQSWVNGNGTSCEAHIFSAGFGATGNAINPGGVACPLPEGPSGGCSTSPANEPPVPPVDPPKYAGFVDSTNCQSGATPKLPAWQFTAAGRVQPGCYDPCKISSVTDAMVFDPGDYAFFGNGIQDGCNFNFGGMTKNGTATGTGVTFWLYNGTGMCSTSGCNSSGSGSLAFTAPTSGSNTGLLVNSPCQNPPNCTGNGSIFLKGPTGGGGSAAYVFGTIAAPSLIYAPYSSCTILANAGQAINGQIVCQTAQIQGGSVSSGDGIFFGGGGLPPSIFDVRLIE